GCFMMKMRMPAVSQQVSRLLLRTQRSMPISNKSSVPAAWAEDRKPQVLRGSKRMREFRGPTCLSDRKAGRLQNHAGAILLRASLLVDANRQGARKQSIPWGKPWRMRERARFFADHNKRCI